MSAFNEHMRKQKQEYTENLKAHIALLKGEKYEPTVVISDDGETWTIPYTNGPYATQASRDTDTPNLEETNMNTTAEEVAAEIFDGTNGTEADRHFQDVQADEKSQLAEQLEALDIADRRDMEDHVYVVAMVRDYADQFPFNPFRVMSHTKGEVWSHENHAVYTRDTLLPKAREFSVKLAKSKYVGTDQWQSTKDRHDSETRAKMEEMAICFRIAAELRVLHDQIGYEFEQRSEVEGFYFTWNPMSEEGMKSHGSVAKLDASVVELQDLDAEIAAAIASAEDYFDGHRKGTEGDEPTNDEFNELS